MITLSKQAKEFIKAQKSMEEFAEAVGMSPVRVYAFLKDEPVSTNFVARFLDKFGMDFEAAFELKPDSK